MRNKRLQNQVTTGRWTLPAVIIVCTLCWLLSYFLFPHLRLTSDNGANTLFEQFTLAFPMPVWAEHVTSYLIYAIIGYFLIELNNRFAIIRMRASVQTAIYFLFVTVCPRMHLLYAGDIASLAFLISLYFLFSSYQQSHPSGALFHSFFFIGTGSLFFPQLTFLSVLWMIGAYRFQSLNLRSFCAALIGWTLPYWFLLGYTFLYGQIELFYQAFHSLAAFGKAFDLNSLHSWEFAILGYLFVLFAASTGHCITAGFEDKIRTRAYLQFLIDLTGFLFLAIALQPNYYDELLPTLMISTSILTGHFFVLTNSKASNIFFIVSIVGLILLFAYNIWTLL